MASMQRTLLRKFLRKQIVKQNPNENRKFRWERFKAIWKSFQEKRKGSGYVQ